MRRHAGMVYATCLKVTRDPHDAEDATQATFLTLAAKGRINGEIHTPEAWLRKVAHRLALDLIRSKKRRTTRETVRGEMISEVQPQSSHDHADHAEAKRILNEELAKLPSSYRMPLILHYFGGLSREEMAEQLKVKPSTLGVRLHRAREQLRKRMTARGLALPSAAVALLLTEAVRGKIVGSILSQVSTKSVALGAAHASVYGTSASFGLPTVASILAGLRGTMNAVALSKFKLAGVALLLATAVSVSAAKIIQVLPAAIRHYLPSLGWPQFNKPSFQLPVVPKLTSAQPVNERAPITLPSQEAVQPADLPAPPAEIFASMEIPERIAAPTIPISTPIDPSFKLPSPVVMTVPTKQVGPAQPITTTFARASSLTLTPVRGSTVSFTPSTPLARQTNTTSSSLAGGSSPLRGASTGQRLDPWNSVLPDDSIDGQPGASVASASTGGSLGTTTDVKGVGKTLGTAVPQVLATEWASAQSIASTDSTSSASPSTPRISYAVDKSGNTSVSVVVSSSKASTSTSKSDVTIAAATESETQLIRYVDTSPVVGGYDLQKALPSKLDDASQSLGVVGWAKPDAAFYAVRRHHDGAVSAGEFVALPPSPLDKPQGANSVRLTVHGCDSAVQVDYLDTSFSALPPTPEGHTFFGFWSLDHEGKLTGVDLLVRYDEIRLARMGLHEWAVKLWVSDGTNWFNLVGDPSFGRDTTQNLVWASYAGSDVKYFAVSNPEPATLMVLGATGALLLKRRRR
ncbi:MAG: sigma-70 family RNA polymerase sigma factor [Tepidisphaeraceae bacterium]